MNGIFNTITRGIQKSLHYYYRLESVLLFVEHFQRKSAHR